MARRRSYGGRLRAAGLVGGLTLGILLLIFLQFALPYWMGLTGLIALGFVDAAIYLEVRHRRAVRNRASRDNRAVGPPQRLAVTQAKRRFEDETVATVALLLFIVGFFVQGLSLRITNPAYPPATTNEILWWVGFAVVTIALLLLAPYRWRPYDWNSESEKYDTTEDH